MPIKSCLGKTFGGLAGPHWYPKGLMPELHYLILEAADWTDESAFTRFYKRAIVNDNFAKSVLSEHVHCSDSGESG